LTVGPSGLCHDIHLMPASTKASISIIGTGRLGTALALGLQRSGYPIVGLVADHLQKAKVAARLLRRDTPHRVGKYVSDSKQVVLAAKDLRRLPPSDIILICTPDDEIEKLAKRLAGHAKTRTVLHSSGALSSAVLAPLARVGLQTGSLHPLISVSEPKAGAEALEGAFFCVEGDPQAIHVARRIVADLRGSSFSIPSESKALYHAAAVMASPHLVALFDIAVSMLAGCGLDRKTARKVLIPLVESTIDNLKVSDSAEALTGTFARGDLATVKRHLKALSGKQHQRARGVYELLGLHALELAETKGLDPKLIKAIRTLLK
jgi:predicted short-subunit dehydrogenase-like oxidoreductase (DUF2520 family)